VTTPSGIWSSSLVRGFSSIMGYIITTNNLEMFSRDIMVIMSAVWTVTTDSTPVDFKNIPNTVFFDR
jgi:hypothetical protein